MLRRFVLPSAARAHDASEVVSGVAHLAGFCRDAAGATRAVRWAVVDATGADTALDLGARSATGVNDRGDVAGTRVATKAGGRTGFLWDGVAFLTLEPTSRDVGVAGMSGAATRPRQVTGTDNLKGAALHAVP